MPKIPRFLRILSPPGAAIALTVAECALLGAGIWPALFAVDVRSAMQLPFTREQFFDLFVAYNEALWPAVVALWICLDGRRCSATISAPPA